MPKRVQRKRTKGWKMPTNTVSVTRPGKFGNPFKIGQTLKIMGEVFKVLNTRQDIIDAYKWWLLECNDGIEVTLMAKKELKNKNLACFCPLDKSCHADILLEIANK